MDGFKYRPHRGSLTAAMDDQVELGDRADLIAHLSRDLDCVLADSDVRVEPYGYDQRIDWHTCIVIVRNKTAGGKLVFGRHMPDDYFGAVGFTNQQV